MTEFRRSSSDGKYYNFTRELYKIIGLYIIVNFTSKCLYKKTNKETNFI